MCSFLKIALWGAARACGSSCLSLTILIAERNPVKSPASAPSLFFLRNTRHFVDAENKKV